MAKSALNFYPDSIEPLARAALGDTRQLGERLLGGIATPPEQAFAAGIVAQAPKSRAGPRGSYDKFLRDCDIYWFVKECESESYQKTSKLQTDAAVKAAEKHFKVSASVIWAALRTIKAAEDAAHDR
jgi:hypothetical protein